MSHKNKIIDVRDEMPRKIVDEDYHHRDCPGLTLKEEECNPARPNPHLRGRGKPS